MRVVRVRLKKGTRMLLPTYNNNDLLDLEKQKNFLMLSENYWVMRKNNK